MGFSQNFGSRSPSTFFGKRRRTTVIDHFFLSNNIACILSIVHVLLCGYPPKNYLYFQLSVNYYCNFNSKTCIPLLLLLCFVISNSIKGFAAHKWHSSVYTVRIYTQLTDTLTMHKQ